MEHNLTGLFVVSEALGINNLIRTLMSSFCVVKGSSRLRLDLRIQSRLETPNVAYPPLLSSVVVCELDHKLEDAALVVSRVSIEHRGV